MTGYLIDLNLLDDKTDTKSTSLHAKIDNLGFTDIDSAKVNMHNYSADSVSGWLKGEYPIPIRVLRSPNSMKNRIEYLCCKASLHKVKLPKLDYNLSYFLGVIFGDGHVRNHFRKKGYRYFEIAIQKKRTQYSEFILPMLIESIFGIRPRKHIRKNDKNIITLSINSKIISRLLTNIFSFSYGKKSAKTIDIIKELPRSLQLGFVAGLFDTDGGVCWNSYSFCNSSKKAVLFVRDILSKEGILTKLYPQKNGKFKWYQVYIIKKDKEKFLKLLSLKNKSKYATGEI
ncbi:MAG: LAGLIDADG family homing endonuclease [Candidatus Diapherotrites archaeon]|nr:LAGLIDADG family homing endonuclease [Candidatus Diapherotrites archaeon]